MRRAFLILAALLPGVTAAVAQTQPSFAVLVLTKTTGYRHDSIAPGIAAIKSLGQTHGFAVDATEDATRFSDAGLAGFRAVIFLNTTGSLFQPAERESLERFIRRGGGFVGIHSASDTEYGWPWYERLVGAHFASHPHIQPGSIRIEDKAHPSTRTLPAIWQRTDEWYDFTASPRGKVRVLATLDEASYTGGTMGRDHPIAWCQDFEGGRSWYTALGHTAASYGEPLFLQHILGGIRSAAGVEPASCAIGP